MGQFLTSDICHIMNVGIRLVAAILEIDSNLLLWVVISVDHGSARSRLNALQLFYS